MRKLPTIALAAILFIPLQARAEGPPRIVSLAPSITEIIYAIGAEDRLIGVSRQCDYPVAAKLLPKMGDFNRPDMEKVAAASPDLVLLAEYVRPGDIESLKTAGIKSVVLSSADIADTISTIREVGRITGREKEGDILARDLEDGVRGITSALEKISPEDRPLVYIEVDGPARLYAVGPGSFMGDVIRLAGGRNAFENGPGPYFQLTSEEVVRADPDVILIDHPFQYKVGVSERPGWDGIKAVRSGRVYDGTDFDIILLNRPGPRIVKSLEEIARLLHPGVFNDR